MAIWASGTPEQFLMHVHRAFLACKQIGLESNFKEAKKAPKQKKLDTDIAKQAYARTCNLAKKKGQ